METAASFEARLAPWPHSTNPNFAQLSESGLLDQIAPPAAKLLDSVSIGNCTNSVMAVTIDCDLMLCDQHFLTAWS
jgi:hypothetical protein